MSISIRSWHHSTQCGHVTHKWPITCMYVSPCGSICLIHFHSMQKSKPTLPAFCWTLLLGFPPRKPNIKTPNKFIISPDLHISIHGTKTMLKLKTLKFNFSLPSFPLLTHNSISCQCFTLRHSCNVIFYFDFNSCHSISGPPPGS